jgi:hypothetical protein
MGLEPTNSFINNYPHSFDKLLCIAPRLPEIKIESNS